MNGLRMWIIQRIPWLRIPVDTIGAIDIVEILLLSFLVYTILIWIKDTRAWTLLKGTIALVCICALIYLFEMDTLIFLIRKGLNLLIIAVVIIFQPELRHALEHLGEKIYVFNWLISGVEKDFEQRCSDRTIVELTKAAVIMAKAKTGALMVLERNETLSEYEKTGISLNAEVSSELLVNIFEHNTPLHDGAVLIKGDKILSATCYLPLSESLTLSKELGTRHRAAVGISEVTDSLTIVVSEETGRISVATRGRLIRNVKEERLMEELTVFQNKVQTSKKSLVGNTFKKMKEKKSDETNEKQV